MHRYHAASAATAVCRIASARALRRRRAVVMCGSAVIRVKLPSADVTLPEVAIFDAHFHVIDPRFPLVPNQGYLPEPFTVADYRARVARLDVTGGAVVSRLLPGLRPDLPRRRARAARRGLRRRGQRPADITDHEVLALYAGGVRAFRVNLFRGGDLDQIALAQRFDELAGWHLEVYLDGRDLPELAPKLAHGAAARDRPSRDEHRLPDVLRLVEDGAYVKATGFGASTSTSAAALRAIADVNPAALLFGSDLPGTRAQARRSRPRTSSWCARSPASARCTTTPLALYR